jgi:CRP/FNR family transcriptional regulator
MLALLDTCHAFSSARGRLCACLEQPDLGHLRNAASDLRLPAGAKIFGEGMRTDFIYGLRQGAVALSRHMADGRRQILAFLFPGDCFGFAVDGVHGCTAVALRASAFCQIPVSALDEQPNLAVRLHGIACARLADSLEHVVRLGRMSAQERVADFLYRLWHRLDCPAEIDLPMHLGDIADHLGLRPETVCRHLGTLRRKGSIGSLAQDGILPILDGPSLRRG